MWRRTTRAAARQKPRPLHPARPRSRARLLFTHRPSPSPPPSIQFIVFECQGHKVQTRALRHAGKDAAWADAYALECPGSGTGAEKMRGPLAAAVYAHGGVLSGGGDNLIGAGEVSSGLPSGTSTTPITIHLTQDDGTSAGTLTFNAALKEAASLHGHVGGGEAGGAGLATGVGAGAGAGMAAGGGVGGAARAPSPSRKADVAAEKEGAGKGIEGFGAGAGAGATAPTTPPHGTTAATSTIATRREGAMGRAEEGLERMREAVTGGGGKAGKVGGTTGATRGFGRRGPIPTREMDVAYEGGVGGTSSYTTSTIGERSHGEQGARLEKGAVIDSKETSAIEEIEILREKVIPVRETRVFEKVFRVTTTFLGERELTDRRRIETGAAVVREVQATAPTAATAGAPALVVEEGAERKHIPPGPAYATGGVVGVEETGGGTGTGGGGRSFGQAIKETLGLGGGTTEETAGTATTTKGARAAEVSEAERASLSRAEA